MPAGHGRGGLLGHVVGHGEGNVLQRSQRVVGGAGQVGRESRDGRHGGQHIVEGRRGTHRGHAQQVRLLAGHEQLGGGDGPGTVGPVADEGQDHAALGVRQRLHFHMRAHAPEMVEAVEHVAGEPGLDDLDMGTGRFQPGRSLLHHGTHAGLQGQAAAGIQQQAYAQAAHLGGVHVEAAPGNVLVRQAHAVARIGQGQRLHHQRGIGHAARHGAGAAAGIGRVDGHAAQAGLEAEDAAPACGQADGAANVRAHMQRPVAGRRSGARACAGAARRLVRIPGVEGVAVQRGQAGGQHAVVGHGGLGEEDGARFAQARSGRGI